MTDSDTLPSLLGIISTAPLLGCIDLQSLMFGLQPLHQGRLKTAAQEYVVPKSIPYHARRKSKPSPSNRCNSEKSRLGLLVRPLVSVAC